MNDYELALKIKEAISFSSNGIVEIPIGTFVRAWFAGKRVTELEFTKKMLNFAEKSELKYVTILINKRPHTIRFWQRKLLEDKNVQN